MGDKKFTKWGKSWKSLKKPWGSRLKWDKSVWERKRESYRERNRRKWAADRTRRFYRPSVNLNRCRCREVLRQLSRKVLRKWSLIDTGLEEVLRNNPSDARAEAGSIHQLSRSYRGGRRFLDLSTRYREVIEIAIWKSLRNSIDSKVSRRCRGGVELALKSSFSRSEKHRYECNPTCNSTNDPNTI